MPRSLALPYSHSEPPRGFLQQANRAFEAGNYREALRGYLLTQVLRPGLNAGLEGNLERCLKRLLDGSTPREQQLTLPQPLQPMVSILVPMHEQLLATVACLTAIADHSGSIAYEVLVLNDASSEPTRQSLERIEGLRLINQPRNLGFLRNCNEGARHARGHYLLWLNNDTLVQPGWLEALVQMAEHQPRVGAVGAQLRYADGRLQEVGGIVWRDGSGARVGDGEWPDRRLTTRPREVDYCSAAALLVRHGLWLELGGFDPRYAPAYYEDTDLCFRIREAGRRILVQPKALVVHLDGLSHGRDISQGVKAHQQINQATFVERWRSRLEREHQPSGQQLHWAMDRAQARPMVLVADHKLPEPDRDAGSRSILHLMRGLVRSGVLVAFWPQNPTLAEPYRQQLEEEGILLLADGDGPLDLATWVREQRPVLDWLLLSRPDVAEAVLSTIGHQPWLRLAYYGHDLHYRRLERQAAYDDDPEVMQQAALVLAQEQRVWEQVELVYYPAADEVDEVQGWLRDRQHQATVRQLPVFAYDASALAGALDRQPPPQSRILFVAGFAHPPNAAAALWFVEHVWPHLLENCPEAELWLVGSHPPPEVMALAARGIQVTGSVSDLELEHHYRQTRIAVAPIRHGAGVNGKVVEALRHGVPCVTTSAAARGFRDPQGALRVVDDPLAFAQACEELLNQDDLWLEQAYRGMAYVERHFSTIQLAQALEPLVGP